MRWQYAILARAKRSLRTKFEIDHELRMMERADLRHSVSDWRSQVLDLRTQNRALREMVSNLGRELRGSVAATGST